MSLLQAAMGRVFFVLITGEGPGLRPGLGEPPPLSIGLVPSLIIETRLANARPAASRLGDRRGIDDGGDRAAWATQWHAGLPGFCRRLGAFRRLRSAACLQDGAHKLLR